MYSLIRCLIRDVDGRVVQVHQVRYAGSVVISTTVEPTKRQIARSIAAYGKRRRASTRTLT
jgi:hypothetical protein